MAARRTPVLLWCAALVAAPTVLAGVSTVWPGVPVSTAEAAAVPGVAGGTDGAGTDVATTAVPGPAVVPGAGAEGPAPTAPSPTAPSPTTVAQPVAEQVAALVAEGPVRFTADSAALQGEAVDTVRMVAAVLVAAPEVSVVLTGHVADTPGSPEGAQALSERRAAAVGDALVAGGVDRARITTAGAGAAEPLDTRAASRRVEFEIR